MFSTQLPTSAIQSMELITGAPEAEFGDKTSLVDQITTRSGRGALRAFGSVNAYYGTFGSTGGDVGLGFGNEKIRQLPGARWCPERTFSRYAGVRADS